MAKKDQKKAAEEPLKEPSVSETEATVENGEEQQPEQYILTAEEFQKVQEHIESLTKEKAEAVNLLQRNQADFDNYRKRNASARAESHEEGRRDVLKELLPVLDNFDRAMEADASSAGAWQDGVKMVHHQLLETLKKMGLEEIPADGDFDPKMHNAILSEKVEGTESGKILMVLQKGYRLKETIIRYSMVKVSE